jgi:hypothetical protein
MSPLPHVAGPPCATAGSPSSAKAGRAGPLCWAAGSATRGMLPASGLRATAATRRVLYTPSIGLRSRDWLPPDYGGMPLTDCKPSATSTMIPCRT